MSNPGFRSFVVLAEMRTGSNFLEQNINQFPDLQSHGELFNPHFIGGAKKDTLFGITLNSREKDPFALLDAIQADLRQNYSDAESIGFLRLTQIAGVTGQW